MDRMNSKNCGHHRTSPESSGDLPQKEEQEHAVRTVEKDVDRVVAGGVADWERAG